MFQVQEELNNTRVKLIEKEREVERLDTQMKAATKGKAAQLKRQGSQDLSEKLEKEAQSLRERTNILEQENEKLAHENRQLLKDQVIKAMFLQKLSNENNDENQSCPQLPKKIMNDKLNKQRLCRCHKNELIKTIPTITHNL